LAAVEGLAQPVVEAESVLLGTLLDDLASEIQLAKQEVGESLRAAVTALIGGVVAVFAVIAFLVMAIVTVVTDVSLHSLTFIGSPSRWSPSSHLGAAVDRRRGLVRPLSSRVATCHAAELQHPSGTQQERDHATEQSSQQKVESKWNRPLDAEKTRARGRQVLENEDQDEDEEQHAEP
jgi:hypothetical protein